MQSKHSGRFYKRRRESHVRILLEHFEERQGSDIEQSVVIDLLNLNSFQKVQATNAVKEAFSSASVIRKRFGNDRVIYILLTNHR